MPTYWSETDSPLGTLLLTADDTGLTGLYMEEHRHGPGGVQPGWIRDDSRFDDARKQLHAYFSGELHEFDLPLNPAGTTFQQEVWTALRAIPYGEVRSYGDIAEQIGKPGAARAVGLANGRNPIAIIVPCHRVIGASGQLTGYGGGVDRKRRLLDLESTATQPI
ncbi:methylated-DNA--[protein]-cysteine S-methyltransferase [Actinobacteria bacterium YIM 96077]|uniref:Methylated-DNA--protein-cysteine methyltransferase n=1 Tax=Phytoactinopolyspora halophila TaxID=1981511 RepID=A0A329R0K6_9ACTN|nr:methylated-DNA--[protein]-cysteine S-methyltransferase [Phytoactinopolyspora halophila]AYY11461.1 methylated-DNA--[protein]-cysteine S-methyltransferase [Actinobacteria bacterium YIM 96077]RAW18057.1 cysteine methyltransferase [Phytoactinopolyspora halophila]